MNHGKPSDLSAGGLCAWQLPLDDTSPSLARALVTATATALGLDRSTVDDCALAVSETSTNALQHATTDPERRSKTRAELWIWARTACAPQLVVAVFDTARTKLPRRDGTEPVQLDDLLEEHGKGLGIVSAVTAEWGTRMTRSRFATPVAAGKAVWFALPLPAPWPGVSRSIPPDKAAHALGYSLAARGIRSECRSDDPGISIVQAHGLNVWVEPKCFAWRTGNGDYLRHPLLDLQETVECVIDEIEQDGTTPDRSR